MQHSCIKYIKHAGFTLVELIIALSISALVLIIIFHFVTDTVIQLAETNKNSKFLGDFARFTSRINAHMSTFPDVEIFIDESATLGHDVLLLKNPESTNAILWGVVDSDTLRLLPNSEFGKYKDAVMGYRLISTSELSDITSTPNNVYDYDFFGDKIFSDFKVKDFQAEYYNGTDIVTIDLSIATTFEQDLVGDEWSVLPKDSLFEVNLNF